MEDKCPKCGYEGEMEVTEVQRFDYGAKIVPVAWKCPRCGEQM